MTVPIPEYIRKIRADLARDFGPRAERARIRYTPRTSHRVIAGVRCLVLDPPGGPSQDVMMYLFGGGYVSGSPDYEMPVVGHLCEACDLTFVLPDYALAPEQPYPAALNEAHAVYRALTAGNDRAVLLGGESAGGGLALCLQAEIERSSLLPPAALCLLSPWLDLTENGLVEAERIDDPTISAEDLRYCAKAYCSEGQRVAASPGLSHLLHRRPPLYLSTGTRDIMKPAIEAYAARCKAAGHSVDLKVWPDMWHVFELYDEVPEARTALDHAARFLSGALATIHQLGRSKT